MDVMEILRESVDRSASDVLISAGAPITFHIHGALHPLDPDWILSGSETQNLVYQFLTMEQRKHFEMERELDVGYHVPDLARFRVSVFKEKGNFGIVHGKFSGPAAIQCYEAG